MCFGNEGFFAGSYLLNYWQGPVIPLGGFMQTLIPFIGNENGELTLGAFVVFVLLMPIMAIKQSINVVQFFQAAVDIVEVDLKERTKGVLNRKIKSDVSKKHK